MFHHNKVGGIRFFRIGRIRLSYCVARKLPSVAAARPALDWQWIDSAIVAASALVGAGLGQFLT